MFRVDGSIPSSKQPALTAALHIVLIALLGFVIFFNTHDVPFLYDDIANIVENPVIKDLGYFAKPSSAKGFRGFAEYPALIKRYVGHLSFALNYRLHGLDVTGYHITNLTIHVINGVLLYLLVILTFRTPRMQGAALGRRAGLIALFSALLFVSHPVQTQAVTYIVQRLASMAAMFYLGSVVLYAGSRLTERKAARYSMYALSLVSAVLAMKTKEVAFTLPLAIAMYEFMFFGGERGRWKKRLICLVPIFLTMLIIPLTMMMFVSADTSAPEAMGELDDLIKSPTQELSRLEYLATEMRVIVTYARLLFLPVNQNLVYDYPLSHSFWEPRVIVSFVFLASILGLGVYMLRRSYGGGGRPAARPAARLAAFGVFWFFLALSVESTLIPLLAINEHRLYLPSVGAILAAVTGLFLLTERVDSKRIWNVMIAFLATLAILLSAVAYERNSVWKTEIILWNDVVRKSPGKATGHTNLGKAYWLRGMNSKAIEQYQVALEIDCMSLEAMVNLANMYKSEGQFDKAIEYYRLAIQVSPNYTPAHFNLGTSYLQKKDYARARREFETVLSINPSDPWARQFLKHISKLLETEGSTSKR
jgi:tetratricopeptide (TPR) repeat protein